MEGEEEEEVSYHSDLHDWLVDSRQCPICRHCGRGRSESCPPVEHY